MDYAFDIMPTNLFLTADHKSFSYSLLRFHFSICFMHAYLLIEGFLAQLF